MHTAYLGFFVEGHQKGVWNIPLLGQGGNLLLISLPAPPYDPLSVVNEYGNEKKPIHPASGFAARLNEHWCIDLAAARRRIEAWRIHHHTVRSAFSFRRGSVWQAKGAMEKTVAP